MKELSYEELLVVEAGCKGCRVGSVVGGCGAVLLGVASGNVVAVVLGVGAVWGALLS